MISSGETKRELLQRLVELDGDMLREERKKQELAYFCVTGVNMPYTMDQYLHACMTYEYYQSEYDKVCQAIEYINRRGAVT